MSTLAKNLARTVFVPAATLILQSAFFCHAEAVSPRQQTQTVNVDFDHQADFARCTSYSWVQGQPARNPSVDSLIVWHIDEALRAKGWTKVDQGATCLVLYQASLSEEKPAQTWGHGMGSGWTISGGVPNLRINRILKGMLVVDIGDAESKQIIWRAIATDTIADTDRQNEKKLDEIMKRMFKDFPPGAATPKIQ